MIQIQPTERMRPDEAGRGVIFPLTFRVGFDGGSAMFKYDGETKKAKWAFAGHLTEKFKAILASIECPKP